MPRGNGTGPSGMGPRTGRGFGNCATSSGRMMGRGLGLALGLGLGLGLRRGFRRFWNRNSSDELSMLKNQAEVLQQELELIRTKISEMEQG